eukprot:3487379-Pyramimonas_sp.AAC.1
MPKSSTSYSSSLSMPKSSTMYSLHPAPEFLQLIDAEQLYEALVRAVNRQPSHRREARGAPST